MAIGSPKILCESRIWWMGGRTYRGYSGVPKSYVPASLSVSLCPIRSILALNFNITHPTDNSEMIF